MRAPPPKQGQEPNGAIRIRPRYAEIRQRGVLTNDDQRREAIVYIEAGIHKYERLREQH